MKNVSAVDNLAVSYVRKPAIREVKSQLKITTEGAFYPVSIHGRGKYGQI